MPETDVPARRRDVPGPVKDVAETATAPPPPNPSHERLNSPGARTITPASAGSGREQDPRTGRRFFRKEPVIALFDLTTDLLSQAMLGSSARQAALANNIANANTPGYKRMDVDFHHVMEDALADGLSGDDVDGGLDFTAKPDGTGPTRADGGNVDPDIEMASLAENSLEYQALAQIQKTRMHILDTVIGR
jgi:flagellar basal-body rod protein FlgB